MPDLTVERRLVKSPPELWNELSEVDRLAQHLEAFGEIRITKLEPGTAVAWEGDHASGTVSIEASGWGTKVRLTAELPDPAPPEPEPEPQSQPVPDPVREPTVEMPAVAAPPPVEAPRRGFFSRIFRGWMVEPRDEVPEPIAPPAPEPVVPDPEPEPEPEPEPAPVEPEPVEPEPVADEPEGIDADDAQAALDRVLDTLGAAHHRPFSRS